ncbi:hypothetical protein [Nocardia jejuensis]|nr:hypothetical protein [Nocardia jejuensis]
MSRVPGKWDSLPESGGTAAAEADDAVRVVRRAVDGPTRMTGILLCA